MLVPAIFYCPFYMNQVTDKLYHVNYYNNTESLLTPLLVLKITQLYDQLAYGCYIWSEGEIAYYMYINSTDVIVVK